jgi:type VI secretion system protein VasD
MLDRRGFLLLSAGALAACGGEPPPRPPTVVTLTVNGGAGMNPGPDGADRPVTVSVLRLRDPGAFNTADLFALQSDPAAALGADLVGVEQLAVAPGGSASTSISPPPEVTHIGLLAMLREPDGRVWRSTVPVTPNATTAATVTLGPGGMALATS